MTSLQTDAKQSHGYFLVLATITNTYTAAAGTGAGGSWAPGAMSLSGVGLTAGQVLRDMGKTVVSSSQTFRKVQLVTPALSTFGVSGVAGSTAPQADWLTGYITLGFGADGTSTPTPVACYGR